MTAEESQICFVIAPIGEPDTDIRKRSDQILKYVIEPAAMACGYKALRADRISEPGIITSQIIQHIIEDPMVIADLTGRNPNVFYELAVRHALRKPYIQIIASGERIPFDVASIRTVEVNHHDLDSVEAAKAEIIRQIQSMQKAGAEVASPISVAVDIEVLLRRGDPEQRQLAKIIDAVTDLRAGQNELSDFVHLLAKVLLFESPPDTHETAVPNRRRHFLHTSSLAGGGLAGSGPPKTLTNILWSLSQRTVSERIAEKTPQNERDKPAQEKHDIPLWLARRRGLPPQGLGRGL